jgi:hypothetical protein
MDTDNLIAHARSRFDHESARRTLKEKYQAKMLFAHAGGMWQAGPELQAVLLQCSPTEDVVILDLYQTPTKVRAPELFAKAYALWQEQLNAWLVEYEQLNRKR